MSRFFKSAAFPILIVVVLAFFARELIAPSNEQEPPTYSEFLAQVEGDDVESVTLMTEDNTIEVEPADPGAQLYETAFPDNTEQGLVDTLEEKDIAIQVEGLGGGGIFTALIYVLPFLLFIVFWLFLINQMQGGGSKVMSFGKSRAKRMAVDAPKINFRDVAGVDEAVEELEEIKE
ncbi:MAG: ATP-dependent metallopeptidase FtsH/Yme1/Tma family protein, partial [Thermoleophilaceae bacterium]